MYLRVAGCWAKLKQAPMPWHGWGVLKKAPRELWLVFVLKFLASYAYFCLSVNLTSFLSEEFGYDDAKAGWAYGTFGLVTSILGIAFGAIIDVVGVKVALVIGAVFNVVGRFLIFLAHNEAMVGAALYFFFPVAESLAVPVMTIAIKRYTNNTNRTIAYGLFYTVMNVAALLSGNISTALLSGLGCDSSEACDPEDTGTDLFGRHFSARRVIFFTNIVATVAMLGVSLLSFREIAVDEEGRITEFKAERNLKENLRRTLTSRNFYKLVVFMSLVAIVRFIFRHVDATFPKYFKRAFHSEAWGTIYSINPLFVIFAVPLVALYCQKVEHFTMILYGALLSSASTFFLCFNTVPASVVFILVLSMGEAVYSPRVYDYTMEVSPKGEEGLYTTLASAPMFLAKFLVGPLSGALLAKYCSPPSPPQLELDIPAEPVDDCPQPEILWLIIGSISFSAPVLMIALRKWIEVKVVRHEFVRLANLDPEDEGAPLSTRLSMAGDDEDDASAYDEENYDKD
eukprot:Colp12_sorted_trinity150504_noHs@34919